MCRQQDESVRHLFSEQIYNGMLQGTQTMIHGRERISYIYQTGTAKMGRELMLISHFVIEREHCNRIFKERTKQNRELIQEVHTVDTVSVPESQWEQ